MFNDPSRGRVRALERNVMMYRTIQFVLVIHYTEELKKTVVKHVQDHYIEFKDGQMLDRDYSTDTSPKSFYGSLNKWVDEGLIDDKESSEIRHLVNFRNDVAHRLNQLSVDISRYSFHQDFVRRYPDLLKHHDCEAVDRLKKMIKLLNARILHSHRPYVLDLESHYFETAESILFSELKSLERKIKRLASKRRKEDNEVNRELKIIRTEFSDQFQLPYWRLRNRNGRLTKTGSALCNDLFAAGFSTLSIAYVMELSIDSTRARKRAYKARNGES